MAARGQQHAYIHRNGTVQVMRRKPTGQTSEWARIPDRLGVKWADDQSCNQLTTRLRSANYIFWSMDDLTLTRDYADLLVEMLF